MHCIRWPAQCRALNTKQEPLCFRSNYSKGMREAFFFLPKVLGAGTFLACRPQNYANANVCASGCHVACSNSFLDLCGGQELDLANFRCSCSWDS
uniref:HDC14088 n=1 Tax=Drosophila melanogaster TaxID=7227 RepID=Q6IJW4_DROME|nr:TPA_inf: HDC14088 [Drosophila melanogaster]